MPMTGVRSGWRRCGSRSDRELGSLALGIRTTCAAAVWLGAALLGVAGPRKTERGARRTVGLTADPVAVDVGLTDLTNLVLEIVGKGARIVRRALIRVRT